MDASDLLAALETELHFYRRRLFSVFTYGLLLEALLVTGRMRIHSSSETLTNAAYTFAFAMIVLFVFRFHDSYVSHIYRIRWERNDLTKSDERPEGLFPLPSGGHFRPGLNRTWRSRLLSASPSMQLVYLITALAALGIVLVWSVGAEQLRGSV